MTEEDLIESPPRAPSILQHAAELVLRHPSAAAMLLVLALTIASTGGFLLGQGNPRVLTGLGHLSTGTGFGDQGFTAFSPGALAVPFEQTYGRTPPPSLTAEDLTALGENVTREFSVLSGRSVIPVLCDTSLGQPGAPNYLDVRYPATVFGVEAGQITQLFWPRADAAAASGTLQALVSQAQTCPDVANAQASVVTAGLLTGIGDEYAVFSRRPTIVGSPDAVFATVALVRVGADIFEISFVSDSAAVPDAHVRCLAVARAAVQKAAGD